MELVVCLFLGLVAFTVIMVIVEPYRFLPEHLAAKKKVGSTYWGAYAGTPTEDDESLCTIEIQEPSRREHYIAGSTTYDAGRGVKMSGRG